MRCGETFCGQLFRPKHEFGVGKIDEAKMDHKQRIQNQANMKRSITIHRIQQKSMTTVSLSDYLCQS